ncbi:unnamed protein product [Somion occarium]|uniref:Protein kinase domain-containing protein n=1 Tax=Somion occarium TaxID=3059160 RepID=A0ABP1CRS1_9APHY
MLPSDNPELDIFRHIISEPQRSDPLNLTIPVLELLHYNDEYSFVIMPRWGNADSLDQCGFDSLRTAFDFVISLLKVLTFLHNHLIAYRDFKLSNVLVNTYFNNEFSFDYRPFLASKRAKFALCDFNLSVRFPPDTPPSARMCLALESECGSPQYHPPDAANGDIMHDPFAYDVACLGGLFCEVLGYLTPLPPPLAPPLAPFLDRMITPDVSSRYTAPQALAAFTALTERFSAKYLSKPIPQPPQEEEPLPWQSRDRWAGLPDAFIKKHTRIRPPVRPRRKVPQFEGRSYFVD